MHTNIQQTVIPLPPYSLPVYRYTRRLAGHAARTLAHLCVSDKDKDTDVDPLSVTFGISISQLDDGTIDHMAFATDEAVHLIDIGGAATQDKGTLEQSFRAFLGSTTIVLAGFSMPRIALRLHHHLRHHFRMAAFKGRANNDGSIEKLCLRAWISAKVARSKAAQTLVENVRRVDTRHIRKDVLLCLGTLLRQTDILARAVPKITNNEHESYKLSKNGKMELHNSRFKTRVRVSKQSYVEVVSQAGKIYQGQAVRANGKTTEITFRQGIANDVSTVRVVGLDEPTPAEKARDTLLLKVMRDEAKLLDADFVRFLWFQTLEDETSLFPSSITPACLNSLKAYVKHLNTSQAIVAAAMTSEDPIVIVHGPPGTGKTTTISAAAEIWSKLHALSVWIIGHSNVSVKNIAEKLLKREVDFKLIVSKEFYVEWHEHIYEKIVGRLIRTDELPDNTLGMSRLIGNSKVILSTLGLLSNPAIERNGLFDIVPFERLVVDEASQINVFEYMSIFHKFRKSLVKRTPPGVISSFVISPSSAVPPFGQEKVKTLQSRAMFDILVFLPSYQVHSKVYEARLMTRHNIAQLDCVRFVDTSIGAEEKCGSSWTNQSEVSVIIHLIRNYYQKMNFCIITPYDAQRAAIERQLRQEKLPWDVVFNVDSFQGNEADYVLLSVVRSAHVGFLHSPQRMNVMLTRCRRGMVVVSRRSFLEGVARDTLVGQLSAYWTTREGRNAWVNALDVMNSRVNLPGAPGSKVDPAIATARLSICSRPSHFPHSRAAGPTKPFDVSTLFRKSTISSVAQSLPPATVAHPTAVTPKYRSGKSIHVPPLPKKDIQPFPTSPAVGDVHNRYSLLLGSKNVQKRGARNKNSFDANFEPRQPLPRVSLTRSGNLDTAPRRPYALFSHQSNPTYPVPWHVSDCGTPFLYPEEQDSWKIVRRRRYRDHIIS
ncbi:P-loop containing nucleoside triphosphate hydrolase protein [Lentinula guzmanii]|uniref:P-loop containing nucleoside triphosphate hydrolase protein n=2 Tax=Lentinula TaxID=5352 RepID=A0AA38JAW4_9AGAR|nr:P-loop containing nucleoside triphosphate hydrolase protein [Lentinula guzmanii]